MYGVGLKCFLVLQSSHLGAYGTSLGTYGAELKCLLAKSHSSLTEVLDRAGDDETADAKAHERVHLPERHELHLR